MPVNPQRVQVVFLAAVEAASPAARAAVLDRQCAGDAELRWRVEALLRGHDDPGSLLDRPAVGLLETADLPANAEPAGAPPGAEAPGTRIGPYKLLEPIGEGGFGVVFLAEQTEPVRRKVALKVLKPGKDTRQVVARFEAERQALAILDHPNIAKVFDGGATPSGRPFFVMELVRGVPITDFCEQKRLAVRERLELFESVCRAVQHAHQKGIIHRDLKPSNVLVSRHDVTPVVKVIDFGVAKALGQELTEKTLFTGFAQMVGTPLYMSPEQAGMSDLDVDTRSDIYSLGVLLYELLTGTTPIDRDRLMLADFDEMRRLIREEEPPRPSTRLSESKDTLPSISAQRQTEPAKLTKLVRGELDWIVMKALEKDRGRRYETAVGFAADVQRYLADQPVEASPPSRTYRLKKFLRRNRAPVAAAAVLGASLVAGIIGTSWGLVRARAAEHEARASALQAQTRLEQVEKGIEALMLVFADLDPREEEKKGKTLRLILGDRLVKVADELQVDRLGDPLLVARLQNRLGLSLLRLGMAEQAIPLFAKARDTRLAGLGPDHHDTLASLNNLARGYMEIGNLDQALPLLEETLRRRQATLEADHPDTLRSMNNLAAAHRQAGRPDLALPLFEQVLAARRARLGPDHPETLTSMNNLASAYRFVDKLDQALPLIEEAVRLRKARLGANHSDTLNSMTELAGAYRQAGRLDQALPLMLETHELQKAHLGADHPATISTLGGVAACYRDVGKPEQALLIDIEVNRLWRGKLGPTHTDTLLSTSILAVAYQAAGKSDQALPLFLESAVGMESRRFRHQYSAPIIYNLIGGLEAMGQFDQAETWRRKWLAAVKERSGTDSSPYVAELEALGANLLQQKKWADAESALREVLAVFERNDHDGWSTFSVKSRLGEALLGQGNYPDAEPLLLAGYQGLKQREAKLPKGSKARPAQALDALVRLYDAWGKPDEAAKWRNVAENTKRQR